MNPDEVNNLAGQMWQRMERLSAGIQRGAKSPRARDELKRTLDDVIGFALSNAFVHVGHIPQIVELRQDAQDAQRVLSDLPPETNNAGERGERGELLYQNAINLRRSVDDARYALPLRVQPPRGARVAGRKTRKGKSRSRRLGRARYSRRR